MLKCNFSFLSLRNLLPSLKITFSYSLVAKAIFRLNLALASIQCFFDDSIAPESLDFKSAGCKAVNLGQLEIFTFYEKNLIQNTVS